MSGADIQPNGIQKLKSKSEETFTISKAKEEGVLKGELVLNTASIPSKEVKIKFDLKSVATICEHTDNSSSSDLSLSKTRLPGKVLYTIEY